jgi:hypothetical protein
MGNVRVITKGLGSAGVEDPLDQRQSIGYKITGFSAKVLRPESVVNYWSNPAVAGTELDADTITPVAAVKIGGEGIGAPVLVTGAGDLSTTVLVQPGTRLRLALNGLGLTNANINAAAAIKLTNTNGIALDPDDFVIVAAITVFYDQAA